MRRQSFAKITVQESLHLLHGLTRAANLNITIGFFRKLLSWKPPEVALAAPNTPPSSIFLPFWVVVI